MKKILYSILAAAAVTAACTQFEMDTVPAYKSVADPTVTATAVSDSVITVTVTAGENTSFYGYAVVEGTIKATAAELVANKYTKHSAVVLQGEAKTPQAAQIKYSEETKTVSLELKDLKPFTDYTVYAAAINDMGVESTVVSKTVKTTDGTEPVMVGDLSDYVKFEEVDSVLTVSIPFNDPVALTGTGTAKAHFYAENYVDENGYLIVYKSVDIPADSISVAGNYLVLTVPKAEWIPGAYVSFTYSADIVKNGAGKTNAAFEQNLMAYDSKGNVVWNGLVAYYDYQSWDFSIVDPATLPDEEEGGMEGEDDEEEEEEEEIEPVLFSDWTTLAMPNYTTSKYPLSASKSSPEIAIVYTEPSGRKISYTTDRASISQDGKIMYVGLDEAPEYGATVSYTIAEGTVVDIFGNKNNEFAIEDAYFYSYGYTLDDIIGEYAYKAASATGSAVDEGTWTIVASDNAEKGNVMFTTIYGKECDLAKVYATFDVDSGTLAVGSPQIFTKNDKYYYAFTTFNSSGAAAATPTIFSVTKPGLISSPSGLFGMGAFDLTTGGYLGYFNVYYDIVAQRGTSI